ncbi:hypothetical protein B484DRAFT_421419 [Ochromonadaceae sp. CCMP2298]|nr:hypothetical protein B484DRAFT_421419 [Ochromonadaceae sp. CCMP2298]
MLHITERMLAEKWLVFRILQPSGQLVEGVSEPNISQQLAVDTPRWCACRICVCLSPEDMVFAQYREQGVLLWRGSLQAIDQCFGNSSDLGKGL